MADMINKINEAPKNPGKMLGMFVSLAVWIAGILVSLAVGFGMIDAKLSIPLISSGVTAAAGWIVVILTLLGAILAIIGHFTKK